MENECWAHGLMGLGVISDATTYWPQLPPYRVSNRLHFILGQFKVGLGWLVNAYSSHSATKPVWDHEGGHVGL